MTTAGLYLSRVPVVREGWHYLDRDTRDVLYTTDHTHRRGIMEGREKYRALLRQSFSDILAPENALDRHELRRQAEAEAEALAIAERQLVQEFRTAVPVETPAPKQVLHPTVQQRPTIRRR